MNDITRQMLVIKSLDPSASLGLSEVTGRWYVSARIEIGGDGMLRSIGSHADSPQVVVAEYFDALVRAGENYPKQVLVTNAYSNRREWRWNGAAFAEVPQDLPSPPCQGYSNAGRRS